MGIKIDDLVNRNEDLLKDSKDSESTIIKLTAENKQLNESVGQLMIEKAKITKDFNDANGKLLEDVKNLSKQNVRLILKDVLLKCDALEEAGHGYDYVTMAKYFVGGVLCTFVLSSFRK